MSISVVGAKIVEIQEKQFFNCIIRKIICHHSDNKVAVLYSYEKAKAGLVKADWERRQDELNASEKTFVCYISKTVESQYYFISNYSGKDIDLECIREANSCTEERHSFYKVEYEDKESRELSEDSHHISDSKLKLYYYNLFHRAGDLVKSQLTTYMAMPSVISASVISGSYVVGSILDYLFALRFIHLPLIKEDDDEYYCHVSLYYDECPHDVHILPINIQIYPDIEYNLKLGIKKSRNYEGGKTEKDGLEKSLSFKFTVKYNDVEKEIGIEDVNEKEIGPYSKDKKGTLFYKKIGALRDTFKGMHQFTKEFREQIEGPLGKKNSVVKDVKRLEKGVNRLASRDWNWLKGSLELEPTLSLVWRYYVPDDLSLIRRFIEFEFGIKGEGTLTIDLIELVTTVLNKTKNVAAAGTVVISVGSGGIAAVPAILVNALVYGLITMIKNWLEKPFTAELSLSCNAELTPVRFNNIENDSIEISLKIEIEARLYLAMEAKVAISLSTWVEKAVETEIKAYADSSISAPIEFKLKSKEDKLSLEIESEIGPFKVKVGYSASAAWNVSQKKGRKDETNKKQAKVEGSHSWKFGGVKMEPMQFVFFENEDKEENTTGRG